MKNNTANIKRIFLINITISCLFSCVNKPSVVLKKDIMIPMSDGIEHGGAILFEEAGVYDQREV
jgi:hypothetical protein